MIDRPAPAERSMVVLGDSLAEGRDDPDPAGGWIGWARRLAGHLELPRESVTNVAAPGATAALVAREQLPAVQALRPRLVMLNCGMNDALTGFERSEAAGRLAEVFGWARAVNAALVAGPVPRPPLLDRAPISEFRKKRTLARIHDFNEELRRTASEFGMTFIEPDSVARVGDPSFWSADGIHLNSAGHVYVTDVIVHITGNLLGDLVI